MRFFWAILFAIPLLGSGCGKPFNVFTNSRLSVDGVVQTNNRVVIEMPITPDGGRVVAVPLDTKRSCVEGTKVAVVDVDGLLLNQEFTGPQSACENPIALFREKLDAIAGDATVKSVVLRINTPGGSVTASDILWHDLQSFRQKTGLPVVACLMDVAAGGGYYLATGAEVIIAHPTTLTGGIGVILNLYNLSDALGLLNILPQEVKSGDRIDLGTNLRNLAKEDQEILEAMAKEYHDRFKEIVRSARPAMEKKNEKDIFDGRVFTAKSARELGLIDRIGYLDDAVALAREMGKCGDAQPVLYRRSNDPARSLYAVTPNVPLQATLLPLSVPGLDRTKLPAFLYLWQPDAAYTRLGGR